MGGPSSGLVLNLALVFSFVMLSSFINKKKKIPTYLFHFLIINHLFLFHSGLLHTSRMVWGDKMGRGV